jgi:hypothetical protein
MYGWSWCMLVRSKESVSNLKKCRNLFNNQLLILYVCSTIPENKTRDICGSEEESSDRYFIKILPGTLYILLDNFDSTLLLQQTIYG